MKKSYEEPLIEVVQFSIQDVITVSTGDTETDEDL